VQFTKQGQKCLFTLGPMTAVWQLTHSPNSICDVLQLVSWQLVLYFSFSPCHAKLCNFKCKFKMPLPNIGLWKFMTVETISNLHLWGVAKIPMPKFPLFLNLDHFALGFLTVHLKIDFLHWPFLMNSNYAPWKYMSNGVCT
jgi:hypothetical protein